MYRGISLLAAALVALAAGASEASACACGCDVFDVSGSSMFPMGAGGRLYLEYDFQNQHENWHRSVLTRASDNDDKDLETHFITAGLQYMFTPDWGVQVELPFAVRHFRTTGGASGSDLVTLDWYDLGDLRVRGIYDGFFDDHSLGVTFGFKLPTGNYTYNDRFGDVDRDSEIGSGSVDVLVGGFFRQTLWAGWSLFVHALLDAPVLDRDNYHPGLEFDGALGTYYTWNVADGVNVSPLAQVIEGVRMSDTGKASANPVASGFERVLVSLGVEVDVDPFMFYVDVEAPVYIHTTGDQLVAPILVKAVVSWRF